MSNLNPRRFSNPDTLKHVGSDLLVRLLSPFRDFLASRDVRLPPAPYYGTLDYDALASVFLTPDTDTPDDLAEILYYMHEMSTANAMDNLLDAISELQPPIPVGENPTPADVAVHVWLADPRLLREKHAEQYLVRPRSFVSFVTKTRPVPTYQPPGDDTLSALEASLDAWFERKKRGRGSRVTPHKKDDLVWFLVRHGQPYRREGSIQDGESGSVYYRPEKHDVLIYVPETGELRINAATKGERELYRKAFGLHIFGNEDFFPGDGKYTLAPLKQGRDCLVCSNIDGIDSIVLKEVEFSIPGALWEREIHKADDVFAAFEQRDFVMQDHLKISGAKFKVQFTDADKARMVAIKPPNNAQYGRDEDSVLVEKWLSANHFIIKEEPHAVPGRPVEQP